MEVEWLSQRITIQLPFGGSSEGDKPYLPHYYLSVPSNSLETLHSQKLAIFIFPPTQVCMLAVW